MRRLALVVAVVVLGTFGVVQPASAKVTPPTGSIAICWTGHMQFRPPLTGNKSTRVIHGTITGSAYKVGCPDFTVQGGRGPITEASVRITFTLDVGSACQFAGFTPRIVNPKISVKLVSNDGRHRLPVATVRASAVSDFSPSGQTRFLGLAPSNKAGTRPFNGALFDTRWHNPDPICGDDVFISNGELALGTTTPG